jgi:transposase-like protein
LKLRPHKDRKAAAADLKSIYLSSTEDAAAAALDDFAAKWDSK